MSINRQSFYLFIWAISILVLSFATDRANFPMLISVFSISFWSYWQLIATKSGNIETRTILLIAILIRLIVVFAFPFFSDDIYRFWWDGKLLISNLNPFDNIPRYYIENQIFVDDYSKFIFEKLNSPDYFSVYPPVCQAIFAIAFWISPNSIFGTAIVIKLFLWLCELGTILLLRHLVQEKVFIYALNPLIIIELCGNAHFEAAMIFFFVAAISVLSHNKSLQKPKNQGFFSFFFDNLFASAKWQNVILAGLFLALSITSKLLTLLFLPFIIKNLEFKKGSLLALSTLFFSYLFFSPFLNETFLTHFNSSLKLYFQNFEFNASIYYILKAIGNAYLGYTPNLWIAQFISLSTIIIFSYFLLKKGEFYQQLFLFFLFYLLLQRAVHPWYLSTFVFLSVFIPSRLGVLWSGLIMLSYIHYWHNAYQENYLIIGIEYLILVIFSRFESQIFPKLP